VLQVGQVWFPNFPQYTIQALIDFSKEGLTLIIQENWRRFPSGLHVVGRFSWKYQKLVFVFIPKEGSLMEVPVDSKIKYKIVHICAKKIAI
jgi:hypothetical protein